MRAYFEVLHRALERQGVDFWWVDWQSGPYSRAAGIDPLWILNHLHFLDNNDTTPRNGAAGLTFSRYAGPGSHRYPIGFSGDTVISWASLAFQPEFTATASNIGYGWWSHDIGGHFWGEGRRARGPVGAAGLLLADPATALRHEPLRHQGTVGVLRARRARR